MPSAWTWTRRCSSPPRPPAPTRTRTPPPPPPHPPGSPPIPSLPGGQVAKLGASVVNMRALADVAGGLGPDGLGTYLLLGKGEESTGGRDKASILADTLEALLGAIYLQHGLGRVAEVIHRQGLQ